MTNKTYKPVLPCGKLYVQGEEYLLLCPYPIEPDSWQLNEQQRWTVVPARNLADVINGKCEIVHRYARHIVCTSPLIEYMTFSNPVLVEQTEMLENGETLDYNALMGGMNETISEEPPELDENIRSFLQSVGAEPRDMTDEELEQHKHAFDWLNELDGYEH